MLFLRRKFYEPALIKIYFSSISLITQNVQSKNDLAELFAPFHGRYFQFFIFGRYFDRYFDFFAGWQIWNLHLIHWLQYLANKKENLSALLFVVFSYLAI